MAFELEGHVAIVTGASGLIGRGIAQILADAGASVCLADIDVDGAKITEEILEEQGSEALVLQVDVSSRSSVQAMTDQVLEQWGRIDILVNGAGVTNSTPVLELSDETWERVVAVNLTGVFLCCQVVGRHMVQRGYGRIVNISSVASQFGAPGLCAYTTSKTGMLGLTRVMSVEWGEFGVTVNAVCPGNVDTDLLRHSLSLRAEIRNCTVDDVIGTIVGKTPVGRLGKPEDVAAAILFLASPEAGFVTGQFLNVCGGRTTNLS